MHNIDPVVLEEAARQERILSTIMYTGLALVCLFVLVVVVKKVSSFSKDYGWGITLRIAFVIAGFLALAWVCFAGIDKLHAYVTAWVLVTTNGASAKFCHTVADIAVFSVVAVAAYWIYVIYQMISK